MSCENKNAIKPFRNKRDGVQRKSVVKVRGTMASWRH